MTEEQKERWFLGIEKISLRQQLEIINAYWEIEMADAKEKLETERLKKQLENFK